MKQEELEKRIIDMMEFHGWKPSDNFNGHIIQGWVKGVRDFYKYINNQK